MVPVTSMQSVTVLFSLFGFPSCYVVNNEPVDDPDHILSAPDEGNSFIKVFIKSLFPYFFVDLAVRHNDIVAAEFIEDNVTLVLHHRDGQKIVASLEDEDDCIYSGYMMGCTTSSALVTGCKGSLQSVQIQSKVFGDMVFTTQDGVVMPLGSQRYRRSADPDIDYDSDDTLDNPEFEDQFSDLASAEADDLPPPPPKLELNLNVNLDKNWGLVLRVLCAMLLYYGLMTLSTQRLTLYMTQQTSSSAVSTCCPVIVSTCTSFPNS